VSRVKTQRKCKKRREGESRWVGRWEHLFARFQGWGVVALRRDSEQESRSKGRGREEGGGRRECKRGKERAEKGLHTYLRIVVVQLCVSVGGVFTGLCVQGLKPLL